MTCPHCSAAIQWGLDRRAWNEDGIGHHACDWLFGEPLAEMKLDIRERDVLAMMPAPWKAPADARAETPVDHKPRVSAPADVSERGGMLPPAGDSRPVPTSQPAAPARDLRATTVWSSR